MNASVRDAYVRASGVPTLRHDIAEEGRPIPRWSSRRERSAHAEYAESDWSLSCRSTPPISARGEHLTPRPSNPSEAVGGQRAVTPPASVIVPPPSGGASRDAVVIRPPTFGRDRRLAAYPVAKDDVVAAGQPAPSSPAAPTVSTETPEVETNSQWTDESASPGEKRAAISTGLRWTIIGRFASEAANLLGVAILARLVAPAEFGRCAIALIVLLLANVPTQAVQYSLVQRKEIDRDHLKTGQTLAIFIGVAMCGLCLALSYTIAPIVFGERTAVLVRLMIPACFINSVNTVQYSILARRLEFRRLTQVDMMISLVTAAVSISLAASGLNGEAIVLGAVAGCTAGYILLCCWILPPIPNFRRRSARELLRSGIPAASNAASMVCFQNCDYVIVGARVGPLQAGYYFRAYTLGVVYQMKVTNVITALGFPVLSRVPSEDEVQRLRRRMVNTITLILFPLLTVLAIVAARFVTFFYGPAWRAAVVPVQILTIGGAAMLIAQAVTVTLLATGRVRAVMLWGWGHFFAYGGAVFAVARLGLPAVAAAAAVVHTTFLLISYVLLLRGRIRQALKTFAEDVLPAAVCSVGNQRRRLRK